MAEDYESYKVEVQADDTYIVKLENTGLPGARGAAGKDGFTPAHEVVDGRIRFKNPDDSWGPWVTVQQPGQVPSLGASAVLEETLQVVGTTIGALNDGDELPEGTSMTDAFKALFQKTIPATYKAPTLTLGVNASTVEVGTTLSVTLSPNFNQEDAGAIAEVRYYRSGQLIHTASIPEVYADNGFVIGQESVTYRVEVDYGQGLVREDNFQNPSPSGRIEAGTKSASKTVTGKYRSFYGPSTPINNAADVRALPEFSYGNSFTLNTGSTRLNHVIAIPATKTLSDVFDVDVNASLKGDYKLNTSITELTDAAGNLVDYKVYILTLFSTYSANHKHNVTLN